MPGTESKREEIVRLAFSRFYDGGFHATGVDTILAESGISKRTLYKYFPSKEDLIEAVLDFYGEDIIRELFDPLPSNADPREQILRFFDIRREMMEKEPTRGCLGIKASQEFSGKNAEIARHGAKAPRRVEERFTTLCIAAGYKRAGDLGRQINILFQGALLLAQVFNEVAPFVAAKEAVKVLLDRTE
ncbi:TetR/AcrR family transcriptional regulator [Nguyenibacter vanlangensis]|uniref:TetR/AcrR family transcriptional regulator n=1 Tax=Nguyenibacter vanlangensis TaxID=1216886 RepID=A0ABZ3D3G7_9PROT